MKKRIIKPINIWIVHFDSGRILTLYKPFAIDKWLRRKRYHTWDINLTESVLVDRHNRIIGKITLVRA